MIGEEKFEELTTNLNSEEIEAIKEGVLVEGMSKRAVLMSYGYPAEHRTPSLRSKEWIYWMNKRRSKRICFTIGDKTISCRKKRKDPDTL